MAAALGGKYLEPSESALRQYLQVLKRQAWLVVLVPVVTLAAIVANLERQEPIYRATSKIVVGESRGALPSQLVDQSTMRTMSNIMEGNTVSRRVLDELGLDQSVEKFQKKLKVQVLPDVSGMDVSYDSTDKLLALTIVRSLNAHFTEVVDETLGVKKPGEGPRTGSFGLIITEVDKPHLLPEAVAPKYGTNIIFGAIAGLALGLLLAVAREALDSRIRARKDAEEWFGAPVVGSLPREMSRRPPPGVGAAAGRRGRMEDRRAASLELLRARLQFTQTSISGPTILVAGAGPFVEKSTVAANVAAALARSGKRVVCVDADVRRPNLYRSFDLPKEAPGLVDVLEDDLPLEEALVDVELLQPGSNGSEPSHRGRLEVLLAGRAPSPLDDALTPETVANLTDRLHERADFVVFDSPPLPVADSYPLALNSDNVLVVARYGRTTKDQAEFARTTLEEIGVRKVGVVLTDAAASPDGYGGY
jgi:capsular polysaccharide biosynthesis protein/Mrp family chromosome partitioning ATPase